MMKTIFYIMIILAAMLTGCRSEKSVVAAEASVMNDTVAAIITEKSEEITENSTISIFSAESLSVRFSADSIKADDIIIYGPKVLVEAKSPGISRETEMKTASADSSSVLIAAASAGSVNRTEDSKSETSAGPTAGDYFQFAGLLVVIILACTIFFKFVHKR